MSSRGCPENVLGTSRINLPGMSLRLRRPLDVISGRPQDVRLGRPRDGQIGSLGNILETLKGDVLGTNICRLGSFPSILVVTGELVSATMSI